MLVGSVLVLMAVEGPGAGGVGRPVYLAKPEGRSHAYMRSHLLKSHTLYTPSECK